MSSKGSTPPYPSAARIADSPCFPQYTASLKCQINTLIALFIAYIFCLEEFNSDKSKCQEHFDVYKECKKKEVPEISSLLFIVLFYIAYFESGGMDPRRIK
ncbi:hypothetical protein CR513_41004, partial [Mucuna pruriens]